MSVQVNTVQEAEDFVARGQQQAQANADRAFAPRVDRFDEAVRAAVLTLANVDHALRRQPVITSLDEVHPALVATYQAAVLEAVLVQQPPAVLEAVNDAADGLFELVTQVITDPDAAIVNDDERLRDACRAWVRGVITTFRETLAAQLPILRSPDEAGH